MHWWMLLFDKHDAELERLAADPIVMQITSKEIIDDESVSSRPNSKFH